MLAGPHTAGKAPKANDQRRAIEVYLSACGFFRTRPFPTATCLIGAAGCTAAQPTATADRRIASDDGLRLISDTAYGTLLL